jgi:magnesium transporter
MFSAFQFLNGEIRRLTLKEMAQCLQNPDGGLLWVDLEEPNEAEEETILLSLFHVHDLALEDCRRGQEEEGHLPKVEDFGEQLFVIFNPVDATPPAQPGEEFRKLTIRTSQLSAFLSKRALVTHHYKPLRSIAYASQLLAKNPQTLGRGPDYFFHIIIDDIVDSYSPLLDRLDESIDAMEEEVFSRASQRTMMRILHLKKDIVTIRRVAFYQREMLNRLSRGEFSLITTDEMIYYRNVYDHLVRMADLAESYRDTVSGLLDAYLSVTSNNLNQVMKVLTIISTVFLPLSVITGFFGMNFVHLPGATWEHGVLVTGLFMLVVAAGMLVLFKKRGWL